jgi:hypothetical protein
VIAPRLIFLFGVLINVLGSAGLLLAISRGDLRGFALSGVCALFGLMLSLSARGYWRV